MPTDMQYSTRLRGYHLQHVDSCPDGWYSAWIYRGDTLVGHAHNEGAGGGDYIHILPAQRRPWLTFLTYIEQNPFCVDTSGARVAHELTPAEDAMYLLREIRDADARLRRSRKARSGALMFRWEGEYDWKDWRSFAYPHLWLSPAASSALRRRLETAPPHLFRFVILGEDNPRFLREQPAELPRPGRPAPGRRL
ncbi:MAG TPA: hypothetical protein VJT67_08285 [Longimicrobiaceae bacterium]|nr:hypothetical protein [Longimicrobiaceae bacterium]